MLRSLTGLFALSLSSLVYAGPELESQLKEMDTKTIQAHVRLRGNAQRGALLFYKSAASCSKCHSTGDDPSPLGPALSKIGTETTVAHIIESLLEPSRKIRKGFETVNIVTTNGEIRSGLIASQDDSRIVLRDASNLSKEVIVPREQIDVMKTSPTSMMPNGLVASLRDEHEFYDLVRYISEIATAGPERAATLQPSPEELVVKDDTIGLDHAGILRSLNDKDFQKGKQIFNGHCINCHGKDGNTPTLPTARAFGTQKLRFGADPYKMFMTVSRGAGLMAALTHLTPRERYQVVHYVREALMKGRNPDYVDVDDAYLAGLPKGTGQGDGVEMVERDYGPVLGSQLGNKVNNALTFRLPNEITVCYDLHRMQIAAAWQGGFLDLSQTHHYRQRGERMPQIDGSEIPALSYWAWELNDSFDIPADAKPPRGPIRENWIQYHGHYLHDDHAILSYAIEGREVLETVDGRKDNDAVSLVHTLRVGPGEKPVRVAVSRLNSTGGPTGVVRESGVVPFEQQRAGDVVIITGQPKGESAPKANANRARHLVAGTKAKQLDLGTPGRTIAVRFKSTEGGTLLASTPRTGDWKPDGKTLFLRGGRLVYDIGWVGAMTSKRPWNDGQWHVATLVVTEDETRMYVDGELEAKRAGFRRDPVDGFVLKVGATATNFGGDLNGDIDWIRIFDEAFSADQIAAWKSEAQPPEEPALFAWSPDQEKNADNESKSSEDWGLICSAKVLDDQDLSWSTDNEGRLILTIPPSDQSRQFRIVRSSLNKKGELAGFRKTCETLSNQTSENLESLTHGGPARWPETLEFAGKLGESINGYALDTIPVPFENPWNAWLRTSALDFLDDGRCVVTTHGGDVYIVTGIDEKLEHVQWKRFAAGLFEPFGVKVVDGTIYVTCRDGLKRLHDFDGNGEADFIEAFWNDDDVSNSFHAYNFDLHTDADGNFYFAKAGQYTQHHRPGSIMRIPPEGHRADVVAWGLRTPNGMGKLPGDLFTVSDNQGPWMPAGKVSLIKPGSFLGNMPINQEQDAWLKAKHGGELPTTFDEPIVWTPQELDNSCGGQVWVGDERFGPLAGRMIHSSFGKGWLYSMSLQTVDGLTFGALFPLPHQWQAGVMRLRVNPADGQLYGTGLSGWQGPDGGADGCLQRLRYTGEPVQMVDNVQVTPDGIELRFTFDVDPKTACNPESYNAEMWNYLWSRRYGSDQFSVRDPERLGHDPLEVSDVVQVDNRCVRLVVPDLAVCDQVELNMQFKDTDGQLFVEKVYMTIHAIPKR